MYKIIFLCGNLRFFIIFKTKIEKKTPIVSHKISEKGKNFRKTYVKPQKPQKQYKLTIDRKSYYFQINSLERKNADLVNYVCPYVKL